MRWRAGRGRVWLLLVASSVLISLLVGAGSAAAQSARPELRLPLPLGTPWLIARGYNVAPGRGLDERYMLELRPARSDGRGGFLEDNTTQLRQPVLAAADGQVVTAQDADACLWLRHDDFTERLVNGNEVYFFTRYCGLQPAEMPRNGDRVRQGEPLGQLHGSAGSASLRFGLFSTNGYKSGEDPAGRTPAERGRVRLSAELLRLPSLVRRDSSGRQDFGFDRWQADGSPNQYGGWVVENRPRPPAQPGRPDTPTGPPDSGARLLVTLALIALVPLALLLIGGTLSGRSSARRFSTRPARAAAAPLGQVEVRTREGAVRAVPIWHWPALIGRQPDCDVPLDDDYASRRHARISAHQGQLVLEDLQSANGTYVNGRRSRLAPLRPGDVVRIGRTAVRLEAHPLGS